MINKWQDYISKGKVAEVNFALDISLYGDASPASKYEDMLEHWDIKLTFNDLECPLKCNIGQ